MPFIKAYPKTPGGRTIVYEDEKGNQTLYQLGTRSWRTNNPGNLGKGAFCTRHGAIGDDGANAIFPDEATGRAAQLALLLGKTYNGLTIPKAIEQYAPKPANDPAAYSKFLLKTTGIAEDKTLSALTDTEWAKLLEAIKTYEGWKEGKIVPPPAQG